jgi:hypothetical protein
MKVIKNLISHFRFLIPLAILLQFGCSDRPDMVNKNSELHDQPKRKDRQPVPEISDKQAYRLWHTIDQFELNQFDFFGEFYDDRLKFYYTDNSQLKIGTANVDLLMLYFLDDRLVKIRYHLDRNIEDYLMDSLGIGLLDTKYTRKKKVYATEKSLNKLKAFNESRNDPHDYAISWDRHVILSSFNVNARSNKRFSFDTIPAKYIYIDQLKSYTKRLIEIENNRLARLKGDSTLSDNLF